MEEPRSREMLKRYQSQSKHTRDPVSRSAIFHRTSGLVSCVRNEETPTTRHQVLVSERDAIATDVELSRITVDS